jgi:hydroxyethylthiazole kinase-like sugar kinase family protein
MNAEKIAARLDAVHGKAPLVHCITNYVTVNDCANALLAVGASPIMSDEPDDVEDITSICDGLDLNIGTLMRSCSIRLELVPRVCEPTRHGRSSSASILGLSAAT